MSHKPSIYDELGVIPVINARGHQTLLGGSTPSPHVKAAMEQAERYFVDMPRLLDRAGEIIASLLGAEAAYVTSGAAAAMALGTAACVTGSDLDAIGRLPDTAGMRSTVLIQKAHHYKYEHATTIVGTTLVDVGDDAGTTPEQLDAALGPDTAVVLYPAHLEGKAGTLSLAQVLAIAHGKSVPVLVDAAGQVYPLDRFTSYPKMGIDLVCFGAKYIGAPQSSGILCGKRSLVAAAAMQGFIGFEMMAGNRAFGRPMKLDRQEIVGVVAALQDWMATDHELRLAGHVSALQAIGRNLEGLPGVRLDIVHGIGAAPRVLRIGVDASTARRSADDVVARLRQGNPAVYVGADVDAVVINPALVRDDDVHIVADRLRELLA